MLFLANYDPLSLLSHFVTHPGTPPKVRHTSRTPPFLVGLVQNTWTKAPFTNSLSIVRRGFCSEGFVRGSFVRKVLSGGGFCPFPLLSEYICYNRKLNITLNFMFHIYDKKCYKCDITYFTPSLCHTFSDPLPLEHDVLYGRPLIKMYENSGRNW